VLVISSPVPPGFSRSQTRKGRALYYLLDPLAVDEDVERAIAPKRLFVGCADSAAPLPRTLQRFLELFGCPIQPMRYESAELARFGLSLMRAAGRSSASLVFALSEKVEATWEEVGSVLENAPTSAANGPGVERDLAVLRRLAEKQGVDASLIESGLARVRQQQDWVLQCIEGQVLKNSPDARLAILGLASRQGTRSSDESPAVALLGLLPKLPVRVYDPAVSADPSWHAGLEAASDALDACRDADAVVIMTPWREFAALDPQALAGHMRGKVIIDPYGVLDPGPVRRAGLAHHTPT
jgi:UDPglucose 6-dehydrogenase